ncbi:cytochrome c oxidase assembly protein [Limnospira platensis]|uniref:cytochrome c oxidase assembly protein n=1 Tax=Limnospira platensis TaxID=118562 RepID=UPI003D6F4627
MSKSQSSDEGVQRTVRKTLWALLGMVLFTIALVPLYDVFCEVTGLNGKTATSAQVMSAQERDDTRWVRVQLVTRSGTGLPWRLEALDQVIAVHPGEIAQARFRFTNTSDVRSSGRAVPSVSPSQGARHFRKMECFCFQEQWLEGGESIELPLVFQVDPALPADIQTLTLAYTLYPMSEVVAQGGYRE